MKEEVKVRTSHPSSLKRDPTSLIEFDSSKVMLGRNFRVDYNKFMKLKPFCVLISPLKKTSWKICCLRFQPDLIKKKKWSSLRCNRGIW